MRKIIRWGIIGCGNVTEIKSGPAFQQAENSQLSVIMRRDAIKAEDYARRHNVAKWYCDASELINDPEVDIVYIATPPDSHMHYALEVARAGKPVYVEKPMARNFSECQKMVRACRKAGVHLFTAFYRRCLPRFLKIKELVDAGAIGNVRFVQMTLFQPTKPDELDKTNLPWRVIPQIAGGGHFIDLACHTLDLLDFYFGAISDVKGLAFNQSRLYQAEDTVAAVFKFKNGIVATGSWCFCADKPVDKVEIIGDQGKIMFATFTSEPVILETKMDKQQFEIVHPPHIQQPLIQSIVNELNRRGKCPSTGESAARTSWVIDEVLKNWRTQNRISFP